MKVEGLGGEWLVLEELYWNGVPAYVVSDDENMLLVTVDTNQNGEHEILEVL